MSLSPSDRCGSCQHARMLHNLSCSMNGCLCAGFVTIDTVPAPAAPPEPPEPPEPPVISILSGGKRATPAPAGTDVLDEIDRLRLGALYHQEEQRKAELTLAQERLDRAIQEKHAFLNSEHIAKRYGITGSGWMINFDLGTGQITRSRK